jgi:2-polyprenyl-6-methoxyphenol hydroxylase-like FAD-dependent oxidoreductase
MAASSSLATIRAGWKCPTAIVCEPGAPVTIGATVVPLSEGDVRSPAMAATETNYDLVIIGGGIGGSALATVMQRAGRSCLVLERTTEYPDRTKGEWIAPWGVAEALQLDLLDVIARARGHFIRRHVSFDPALDPDEALATPTELALLPGVDGPMTQRHPDACQALFDAASEAGADTCRGVEDVVVALEPQPTVTWRDATGAHEATARLVVGADGRNSMVRRSLGFELQQDPPHHYFSGVLVDGADDFDQELQAIGTEGDVHFLAFPQGAGRVRLYLGFGLDQPKRFTGPDGPRAFVDAFRFECMPASEVLATATPVSPCATYPNEDTWVDVPVRDGVVLIGDAAGWNDPITGQGQSIALRDVRIVSEVLQASDDWSAAAFTPYVEERRERMRRLRFGASMQSRIYNEFGSEAAARRLRVWERFEAEPELSLAVVSSIIGPELAPPEVFTEDAWHRILD